MKAPEPENEAARLNKLRSLDVLDSYLEAAAELKRERGRHTTS